MKKITLPPAPEDDDIPLKSIDSNNEGNMLYQHPLQQRKMQHLSLEMIEDRAQALQEVEQKARDLNKIMGSLSDLVGDQGKQISKATATPLTP